MKWSSYEAYQAILEELPGSRQRVFRHLFRHGPSTGRELNEAMGSQSAHKRLSELERQGLIIDSGTRQCRVSGHDSHAWAVIGDGPLLDVIAAGGVSSLPKAAQPTRRELQDEIERLRREVSSLKGGNLGLLLQSTSRGREPPHGGPHNSDDWRARQLSLLGGRNEE